MPVPALIIISISYGHLHKEINRIKVEGINIMTVKTDYTPEEWKRILAAPYFAAMYIIVSDMNVAFFQELAAMSQAVMASISGTKSEFIKTVATDLLSKETQEDIKPELDKLKDQKDPSALMQSMLDHITSSIVLVDEKSAEDGDAYRKYLVYLAQITAEGSKEGGFLGIGAVRVSEKEQAALDELAQVLGLAES
jgi:hypothetical protein